MKEAQALRMKHLPFDQAFKRPAAVFQAGGAYSINRVTQDGETDRGQMDPNLVGPSGQQMKFHQRDARTETPKDFPARQSRPA